MRSDNLKHNLVEMYNSGNYNLWLKPRIGKRQHVPFYKMPSVQPFCSNKTLKHIFGKFPHKPTGSGGFIARTLYYRIRYKCHFSCYFKTGRAQGTECQAFGFDGKKFKFFNILKIWEET